MQYCYTCKTIFDINKEIRNYCSITVYTITCNIINFIFDCRSIQKSIPAVLNKIMQYCYTCKTMFDNKLIKKFAITVVVNDNMQYHKYI